MTSQCAGRPARRLLLIALLSISPLLLNESARAGTRWFKSKAGGFQVGIPDGWHVKENPSQQSYQAALSREKVEKEGNLHQYGISVLRVKDYHSFLKFDAPSAAELAMRFATNLAGGATDAPQGLLISMPGTLRGR